MIDIKYTSAGFRWPGLKYWSVSVPGTFECKIQTNYITCHDYIVYTLYPRDLFWVVVHNCVKHEVATVESEHPEEGIHYLSQ